MTERCGSGGTTSCVGRLLKKSALAFARHPDAADERQREHRHQQAGDHRKHQDREQLRRPVMALALGHTRQRRQARLLAVPGGESCAHGLRRLFPEVAGGAMAGETGGRRDCNGALQLRPGLHRSWRATTGIVSRKAMDGSFWAPRGRTHKHIPGSYASTACPTHAGDPAGIWPTRARPRIVTSSLLLTVSAS